MKILGELNLRELEALLRQHPDQEIRLKAGMRLVQTYEGTEAAYSFDLLIDDDSVPEAVRLAAGKKSIGLYVQGGLYRPLLALARNENAPEEVRRDAAGAVAEAGMKAIESGVEDGNMHSLVELLTIESIPEQVRQAARDNLEVAGRQQISEMVEAGNPVDLKYLANTKEIPSSLRELAAKGMVEIYSRENDYLMLQEIATNREMPLAAQLHACAELIKVYSAEKNCAKHLMALAYNENFPSPVRELAIERALEKCTPHDFDNNYLVSCMASLAGRQDLDERLRMRMGELAVNKYHKESALDNLAALAGNDRIPPQISGMARDKLAEAVPQAAAAYAAGGKWTSLALWADNEKLAEPHRDIFRGELNRYLDSLAQRL